MIRKIYETFFIAVLISVWYGLVFPMFLNVSDTLFFVCGILVSFVITVEAGRRVFKIWQNKEG